MPQSKPTGPEEVPEQETLKSVLDIEQWLENLRRADRSFYNMMALEVWSIAKTMDGLIPGFWNRFMENRRIALKQFMQQKQAQHNSSETASTEALNNEKSEESV